MNKVLSIIKDKSLTYEQKLMSLAREAENSINVLNISEESEIYRKEGIICDLNEGNAPYRPRYIAPDYENFLKNGSDFFGLTPPKNIWEATNNLLILYKHVPSITSFPVYIGNLDTLLEPFVIDEEEAYLAIKLFLTHIDRTITDSFCHANIGPMDTKAGRIILKIQREYPTSIPNISLKYSKETPDSYALDVINTALITAKPSFANDRMFSREFNNNYCIASCYNGLPIGGGSYTLVRLNLAALSEKASDEENFINHVIPDAVKRMTSYMDERIRFIAEESNFFESSFLVREGLISKDNFTAMFGIFGLAESVNHFIDSTDKKDRFGHGEKANNLGFKIIEKVYSEVSKHKNPYCEITKENFLLHAQVGIETDKGISPGCRIPIGEEPEIHEHLLQSCKFHKFFPSGIGDIFNFDKTVKRNPEFLLDIIKGAFKEEMRYLSIYCTDCDVIRITGYLVKKSDMEKLEKGQQVLSDTVVLGLGAVKNSKVLERKVRTNG